MVSGSGTGREKTMPILRRSSITSALGSSMFCAVEQHLPLNSRHIGQVVQAVERAQQGRFAAAGRAKQHGDGVGLECRG